MELESMLAWLAKNNGSLHIDYYGDVTVTINGKLKETRVTSPIDGWHPMDEPNPSSVKIAVVSAIKKAQAL